MVSTSSDIPRTAQSSRSDEPHLHARQVELLYAQSLGTLSGSALAAAIVAAVFWRVAPHSVLVPWLASLLLLGALRLALTQRYRRATDAARQADCWERWFIAGVALTASVWGIGGLLLPPPGLNAYTALYLLWVVGLCATAAATYSVRIRAFLAFALPAMLPYAVYSLVRGTPEGTLLAVMLAMFFAFLLYSAMRSRTVLVGSLRLQFENVRLIGYLDAERKRAEKLNAELRADIDERIRTLETLQHAKQRAEDLARRLQLLSSLDGLTGIANRRHFDEALDREWRRALRNGTTISMILVDIDFFKNYNDTYGHQAGDECLKEVARLLKGYSRRPGDFVARYGGEEFAVVLSETGPDTAGRIAEEIRMGVETLGIPHGSSPAKEVVTVSAGVAAAMPAKRGSPDALIHDADGALYQAKHRGRNRVVVNEPQAMGNIAGPGS